MIDNQCVPLVHKIPKQFVSNMETFCFACETLCFCTGNKINIHAMLDDNACYVGRRIITSLSIWCGLCEVLALQVRTSGRYLGIIYQLKHVGANFEKTYGRFQRNRK